MEKHSPSRRFDSAIYRIRILGTLDKQWSAYCGGMAIEHMNDPHHDFDNDPGGSFGRPVCFHWCPQCTA